MKSKTKKQPLPIYARIESRRTELGLSVNGLARRSGISYSTLQDLLSHKTRYPRVDTLQTIARALDAPAAYFIGELDVIAPNPADLRLAFLDELEPTLRDAALTYELSFVDVCVLYGVGACLAACGKATPETPEAWLALLRSVCPTPTTATPKRTRFSKSKPAAKRAPRPRSGRGH